MYAVIGLLPQTSQGKSSLWELPPVHSRIGPVASISPLPLRDLARDFASYPHTVLLAAHELRILKLNFHFHLSYFVAFAPKHLSHLQEKLSVLPDFCQILLEVKGIADPCFYHFGG